MPAQHCRLAKQMQALLESDGRFEIVSPAVLGVLTFRLRGHSSANDVQALARRIESDGTVTLAAIHAGAKRGPALRFAVTSPASSASDMEQSFRAFERAANALLPRPPDVASTPTKRGLFTCLTRQVTKSQWCSTLPVYSVVFRQLGRAFM